MDINDIKAIIADCESNQRQVLQAKADCFRHTAARPRGDCEGLVRQEWQDCRIHDWLCRMEQDGTDIADFKPDRDWRKQAPQQETEGEL